MAHFDIEVHQMDVNRAFLNVDLKEDVFMVQPDGFILGKSTWSAN